MNISLVLRKKQTLKLPLVHHISGMRCIPTSSSMPQGSKTVQIPALSAPHTAPASPRGTSLPRGRPPQHLPRGLFTLLRSHFPFLQTALFCLCCHAAGGTPRAAPLVAAPQETGHPQTSFYGGAHIQQVGLLVCLQLSWLKVPGYRSLSGGFCYCSPSH